jgi:hypothetical protein
VKQVIRLPVVRDHAALDMQLSVGGASSDWARHEITKNPADEGRVQLGAVIPRAKTIILFGFNVHSLKV